MIANHIFSIATINKYFDRKITLGGAQNRRNLALNLNRPYETDETFSEYLRIATSQLFKIQVKNLKILTPLGSPKVDQNGNLFKVLLIQDQIYQSVST